MILECVRSFVHVLEAKKCRAFVRRIDFGRNNKRANVNLSSVLLFNHRSN